MIINDTYGHWYSGHIYRETSYRDIGYIIPVNDGS